MGNHLKWDISQRYDPTRTFSSKKWVPKSGKCRSKKVERRKTEIVGGLVTEFSLDILLKLSSLSIEPIIIT